MIVFCDCIEREHYILICILHCRACEISLIAFALSKLCIIIIIIIILQDLLLA